MIGLYLLAAHLLGDFVFQTRWQAAGKLTDWRLRARHVAAYCLPFVPIAAVYGNGWAGAEIFVGQLAVFHFVVDSHRFRSTLGDVVQWRIDGHAEPAANVTTWLDYLYGPEAGRSPIDNPARVRAVEKITSRGRLRFPPPNPWPPMPLMIDQTLHVVVLAVLAAAFLR